MQFGLFSSAAARRGGPKFDNGEVPRVHQYNVSRALGYGTFVVGTTSPAMARYRPRSTC
jgi:hypothetical protein